MYRNASIIGDTKVVFNIAGNKYRFIGTHKQYDKSNLSKRNRTIQMH
jgi:mRNA-degrading endonuclease HigB of HigAB toxin-antitoxin module